MDILAHGLWAAAAAKACNLKNKKPSIKKLNALIAAFWGVFPDLFAFTIPFAWLILGPFFGDTVPRLGPPEHGEPPPIDSHWVFHLASTLYNYSHSIVIFLVVIGIIQLMKKRIPWEIGGWLLHILIDIPTHSYEFYPTPFLWPISNFMINGLPWATPWFFLSTYAALVIAYFVIWLIKKRGPPIISSTS